MLAGFMHRRTKICYIERGNLNIVDLLCQLLYNWRLEMDIMSCLAPRPPNEFGFDIQKRAEAR